MLEDEGRVVARYLDVNPNGSLRDIAGITNERGNVVGPDAPSGARRRGPVRSRHRRAAVLHLCDQGIGLRLTRADG